MMNHHNSSRSCSSDSQQKKDMASSATKQEDSLQKRSAIIPSSTSESTGSNNTMKRAAWPLYLPSDNTGFSNLPAFPRKINVPMQRQQQQNRGDDETSKYYSIERTNICSSPSDINYSSSSSSCGESDLEDLEESYLRVKYQSQLYSIAAAMPLGRAGSVVSSPLNLSTVTDQYVAYMNQQRNALHKEPGRSPLFSLSSDTMANVMTFLEPPEVLEVLTMPLCKEWRDAYTSHKDLWRVLCMVKPFNAKVSDNQDDDDDNSSDDSFCSLSSESTGGNDVFSQYRLMYTSFVRCMKYLTRIKEDALNGRSPSVIDYGSVRFPNLGASKSLKKFLARAREVITKNASISSSNNADIAVAPIGVSDDGSSIEDGSAEKKKRESTARDLPPGKRPKYGNSMITARLFGPTSSSDKPGNVNLPKSCAMYSIVNWMVAFSSVEGIQTMCVKTLPILLEDEEQRVVAQRAGLTEVILRAMVLFPDSLELHIEAFHTMVLLARPLGGREGMLFDNSRADPSMNGLLGGASTSRNAQPSASRAALPGKSSSRPEHGMNGIAIMIESMRRFQSEAKLQAMACWAMVNIALAPAQKRMLIRLGGMQATTNAMARHSDNADVQFRALFALINLVIPSKGDSEQLLHDGSQRFAEKDVLDELIGDICSLVVAAMKNFCSSESILNRACLVLHNLSQNQENLNTLLWTPHCYQMLEWCIGNYPSDQVLRRSAVSTLHRLQVALSNDDQLRSRFMDSIRVEQELSLRRSPSFRPMNRR